MNNRYELKMQETVQTQSDSILDLLLIPEVKKINLLNKTTQTALSQHFMKCSTKICTPPPPS